MADESTSIELYRGTEVEDGTMPVDDMVDALVGFSGVYAKIAHSQFSPEYGHRIRVVGLQRGSAQIVGDVVEWSGRIPKQPRYSSAGPASHLLSSPFGPKSVTHVSGTFCYLCLGTDTSDSLQFGFVVPMGL